MTAGGRQHSWAAAPGADGFSRATASSSVRPAAEMDNWGAVLNSVGLVHDEKIAGQGFDEFAQFLGWRLVGARFEHQ